MQQQTHLVNALHTFLTASYCHFCFVVQATYTSMFPINIKHIQHIQHTTLQHHHTVQSLFTQTTTSTWCQLTKSLPLVVNVLVICPWHFLMLHTSKSMICVMFMTTININTFCKCVNQCSSQSTKSNTTTTTILNNKFNNKFNNNNNNNNINNTNNNTNNNCGNNININLNNSNNYYSNNKNINNNNNNKQQQQQQQQQQQ